MLIKSMQVEIKCFALSWQLRQIFSTYLHIEGKSIVFQNVRDAVNSSARGAEREIRWCAASPSLLAKHGTSVIMMIAHD